jgi:hypothetical protein
MGFLNAYFDVLDATKERQVLCPFDHYTANKIPYKESNPSAHVNTLEKLFHCKVCNKGYNELQLIEELFGCDYAHARKLQQAFETDETTEDWENVQLSEETKQRALALGISEAVIEELRIKTPPAPAKQDLILFPVLMYGTLLDIRTYNPGHSPKIMSRPNAPSGLIIPFDLWQNTDPKEPTIICAGEKDMALARTHGFNAITLTGGERALPACPKLFKDRKVIIVYDNDDAGISGANALATELFQYTQQIKVVTGFHEVCKEKGEDITDFFTKYNKNRSDLASYIKATPLFKPETKEEKLAREKSTLPVLDLFQASQPQNINTLIQTNIQVVATSEQTFYAPKSVVLEKFRSSGSQNDTLDPGTIKEWRLTANNLGDLLHLIDNNFKEEDIKENLRSCCHIPKKERCIDTKILASETVYKAYVTDLYETKDADTQPMEYLCYSIGCKLESGKKYLVTHKLVPHPYKGGQLIMIAIGASQANDSITNFALTPEVKRNLAVFRDIQCSTSEQKVAYIARRVKGLLGYNGNDQLIQTIDLAFHTALKFNFGNFKDVRGYLDTLIVGESRVGKSSTAETLKNTYGLGTFVSLAGNSATIPGLVGGSNKTATGYQTRAGIIPQNHKGLVIFEEFGKCNANIVSELTDIRSSNEVRIARVSGTISLPAMVRMISLTNVKATGKTLKPIAAYPHGVSIITELVPTAEDIARYDMILVLSDRATSAINPLWQPEEPFTEQQYRDRIRWIWSRTPEQIEFSGTTQTQIIEESNKLMQEFDSHIKIFGTETWKKLTRLAIAIAGYCVSTDDSFEKIIIKPTHITTAVNFLRKMYDNPTFRFKEYVKHERQYSETDAEATVLLQEVYNKAPSLIQALEQSASVTKNMLAAATGLDNTDLNKQLNRLTKGLFIKIENFDIQPTERFRLTLATINRHAHIQSLGEGGTNA